MSQLSWPGKRRQHVTPDRPAETKWFKSPYLGERAHQQRKITRMFRTNALIPHYTVYYRPCTNLSIT